MLARRHRALLFAHFPDSSLLFLNKERRTGALFPDVDAALEWCEDCVLEQALPRCLGQTRAVALASMDIFSGFDAREISLIESIIVESRYLPGEFIIREGDLADSLYLLAIGRVSIYLSLKNGTRRQRLSTISPGLVFGELAVLDGGTRSADAIADEASLCYVLRLAEIESLAQRHPQIHSKLIFNIGRELSARLRRADAEIRALAD
jgi:glutaminase